MRNRPGTAGAALDRRGSSRLSKFLLRDAPEKLNSLFV